MLHAFVESQGCIALVTQTAAVQACVVVSNLMERQSSVDGSARSLHHPQRAWSWDDGHCSGLGAREGVWWTLPQPPSAGEQLEGLQVPEGRPDFRRQSDRPVQVRMALLYPLRKQRLAKKAADAARQRKGLGTIAQRARNQSSLLRSCIREFVLSMEC